MVELNLITKGTLVQGHSIENYILYLSYLLSVYPYASASINQSKIHWCSHY